MNLKKIKIPWANPIFDNNELTQVIDTFKKQKFTSGLKVKDFEKKLSKYCNAKYGVSVSNGTVALDLALKSQNISIGDEVILPAMSYFSSASSISYQNAIPVFVDIDKNTFNLDPNNIESAITKKTKAIMFIDYGGFPSKVDEINQIAKKNKLIVIQDGAQSLGAIYKKKKMGMNANISTMSFHMAKIMTTVEGGMIFTNNRKVYNEIITLRNIGEPIDKKYIHTHLGTNGRITELQAAIGLEQFKKLSLFLKKRRKICLKYINLLEGIKGIISLPDLEDKFRKSANFFFPILVHNRDYLAGKLLKDYNIDTRIAYPMPIYKQKIYSLKKYNYRKMKCPNAEYVTKKILNLPLYPSMTNKEIEYVCNSLINILNKF